jgi:hypothetical protein
LSVCYLQASRRNSTFLTAALSRGDDRADEAKAEQDA